MQIVACTGQHFFAPESYNLRSLEEITELFIREIEQGIDGTDIKAGVIKVAARSDAVTPAEEKVFKAAARASKATGIPRSNSRQFATTRRFEAGRDLRGGGPESRQGISRTQQRH
jgi:phosphotriesterase-related protein